MHLPHSFLPVRISLKFLLVEMNACTQPQVTASVFILFGIYCDLSLILLYSSAGYGPGYDHKLTGAAGGNMMGLLVAW